jgi:hypothetical protein
MCRTKEGVPLVRAAAVQPEFEFHDVSGTPVGFWTPEREDAQRAGLSTCTSCRPTARAAVISYNGMVNLLVPTTSPGVAVGGLSLTLSLRGHGRARDWLPDLKSLTPLLEVFGGGEPVAFRSEVLSNGTIREEKTLRVR